jgi:hypothetical protein
VDQPRLRFLKLNAVPFPGIPNLLLSTTHLVELRLQKIPHSAYFSPEEIVTGLSRTTSLNILYLEFRFRQSRPDPESRRSLPPTRTVLPALTNLHFTGVSEYLEDLIARIDAPRLDLFLITLFNQFDFDTPQLAQFVSRTPTLKAHDEAYVVIDDDAVTVITDYDRRTTNDRGTLIIKFLFIGSNFRLSSLPWFSTSSLPSLSTVESLYIYDDPYVESDWEEIRVENTEWLDFLRPFTAVKDLYLSDVFGPEIVRALHGSIGGRTTVVLPTLQAVCLEGLQRGPVQEEDIGQFIAARHLSGYPCTVSRWSGANRYGG